MKKPMRHPPEIRDLAKHLCGSMEGAYANESTDISNCVDEPGPGDRTCHQTP